MNQRKWKAIQRILTIMNKHDIEFHTLELASVGEREED